MADQSINTFTVIIKKGASAYSIAANGPKGIRVEPHALDLPEGWLSEAHQATLDKLADKPAPEDRSAPSDEIQALGRTLYDAIFPRAIEQAFYKAKGAGRLRLCLQIEAPELEALPWEALHDGEKWLALQSDLFLVRRFAQEDAAQVFPSLKVSGPLRILFVGASPQDQPSLGIDAVLRGFKESDAFQEAIEAKKKKIEFDDILNASRKDLEDRLGKSYHILYFAAHGSPQGLYLDDGSGEAGEVNGKPQRGPGYESDRLSAEDLARLLEENQQPTRLVFLTACNTAASPSEVASSPDERVGEQAENNAQGFAQKLLATAHLPAVVAMQYRFSDVQAPWLAARFFSRLADSYPVDVAMTEARQVLMGEGQQVSRDVIAPVMYLQAKDGALFQKAKNWFKIALLVMVPILIMLGLLLYVVYLRGQRAEQETLATGLVANSISHLDSELDLALLLGIEAYRTADTVEARDHLLTNLQYSPRLLAFLHDQVSSVAYSPDSKTLAASSNDNTIILWDLSDPHTPVQLDQLLTGHKSGVNSMAYSPDNRTLATGSGDNTIILWDLSDPRAPVQLGQPLTGHKGAVFSVAFSPDGKILASGGCGERDPLRGICSQGEILLWDLADLHSPVQLGRPLIGRVDGGVSSVTFSPASPESSTSGKLLASAHGDDIILWDISDSRLPVQFSPFLISHHNFVQSVVYSPNGRTLAADTTSGGILLWDVSDPHAPVALDEKLIMHTSVTYSPDGRVLALGAQDGIILWDMLVGPYPWPVQLDQPLTGYKNQVDSVVYSPDGKTLVSVSYDGTLILWGMSDYLPTPIQSSFPLAGHKDHVNSVAYSPNGKTLATASSDSTIILWDLSDPRAPVPRGQPLTGHKSGVNSVAYSPDGKTLASGSNDSTIILWDMANPYAPARLGQSLTGHKASVSSVSYSPDGKTLASASSDSTIILWDISAPDAPVQLGQPLTGYKDVIFSVVFSPIPPKSGTGSKVLASGGCGEWDRTYDVCTQGEIRFWDVSDPRAPVQLDQPLIGHKSSVSSVAFNPNGKTLASGSKDGSLILWDVSDRYAPVQLSHSFTGQDEVYSVAYSPDGKTLASGGMFDNIILWDVSDPHKPVQLGQPFTRNWAYVYSMAYSPDGKTLVSGSMYGTTILWTVDIASWQSLACQRAGRNFSRVEWAQYIPWESYRKTCEQWPLEPAVTP